jgi:type IV secretion system protein VirD4
VHRFFFLARFLRGLWTGAGRKDLNQAQWAKAKDIKTLIVPHAGIKGRLVLGRSNGKLIATEPRQSVIVMGPTQTGKTTGFAVPAILEWDGPVIAASVKNDLVKDTFKWRQTQGEVWLFDPTRSTGFDYEDVRAGWSPLSQAIDWGGARKVSSWLCKANKSAGGGLSDGDFWFSAAEKMMSPYLFAAAVGGKDMATILRWIDTQEEREVMSILQRAGVPEAMTAFEANMKRDERTKSSILQRLKQLLMLQRSTCL